MPPTPPTLPALTRTGGLGSHCQRAGPTAESLLGAGHPLVCTCQATIETAVAAAVVQATALALSWAGVPFGRALSIGAGVLQLIVGLRWANMRIERRDLCRDMVIAGRGHLPLAGRGHLPLAALAHERRRLLDRGYQQQLARSPEELARLATVRSSRCPRARPFYSPAGAGRG
jgi:hypothetical protein